MATFFSLVPCGWPPPSAFRPGLLTEVLAGGTDGRPLGQPDDPLHLMRQTERFSIPHSTGKHFHSGARIASARQHVGGGDALYDTPLRRGGLLVSGEALCQSYGLAGTVGTQQTAQANLSHGERIEQDFMIA